MKPTKEFIDRFIGINTFEVYYCVSDKLSILIDNPPKKEMVMNPETVRKFLYGLIEEDKSESSGVIIPDSEYIDFGDKDFTMTWSGKSPLPWINEAREVPRDIWETLDRTDQVANLLSPELTGEDLSINATRSSKGISFYVNGHEIPWWARGVLYKWWYKRLEKKLSKEDVIGEIK